MVELRPLHAISSFPFEQSLVSLGAAAAIRIGALDVVLSSKRAQTFHPDVFRNLGIDLTTRKIVVVKSASHFHAGFAPLAKAVIYVNCGGPYPPDPAKIPYTKSGVPSCPSMRLQSFKFDDAALAVAHRSDIRHLRLSSASSLA